MGIITDFGDFLEEYGVVGLAIAFVIGLAIKDLVSAIVDDVAMPIIAVFLPAGDWQSAILTIGPVDILIGHLISAVIDFLVIALLIFLFVRYGLPKKEEESEE